MTIGRDRLIEDVMWRGGIRDGGMAEAAIGAAVEALAAQLAPADARSIAEELPAPFDGVLERAGRFGAATPAGLYARVAAAEHVGLGPAMEHARAACAAIAEALDGEERVRLVRRLSPEWGELFAPAPLAVEAEELPGTVPGHGHTLATGRPGSRHPLAEAGARSGQADSVVTAENPHADSKLSSAGAGELATARPGTEASLAESKDERRDRDRGG